MYCIHKWGNIHIAVDTLDTREHINTHNYAQIRIYMYARTKCAFTYIHTQARQTKHGQENTSGPCDHRDYNIPCNLNPQYPPILVLVVALILTFIPSLAITITLTFTP